jgi:hypothetical protein
MCHVVLQVGTERRFGARCITAFEQSRAQHPVGSQVPVGGLVIRELVFRFRCLAKTGSRTCKVSRHQGEPARASERAK